MEALEPLLFDEADNEFDTKECVICMENFQDKEAILRVPTCRHFFHPKCC